MKVRLERGYILIIWPWFVRAWGRVVTGTSEAKGAAMFPFLFVRDEEYLQPWLINHERIHFRQQFETLFIGLPIMSLLERLYARFILKMDKKERYLYAASEQEAYLNMDNPAYLNKRPFGALFHYVRNKRRFRLIGPGQIEFLDGMATLGIKRGTVVLVPYDPLWPSLFEKEKQLLLENFGTRIKAIEHIGSTAIPGIPAKPIIDMNVAVESIDDIDDFIQKLPELGYEYIPERRFSDRQFFPKGPAEKRTHHLNLVEIESETGWKNALLFRDYLRTHEAEREEYKRLKEVLASKYADNRDEYTERKSDFVRRIIETAKRSKL